MRRLLIAPKLTYFWYDYSTEFINHSVQQIKEVRPDLYFFYRFHSAESRKQWLDHLSMLLMGGEL